MQLSDYMAREKLRDGEFARRIGRSRVTVNRIRRGLIRPGWDTIKAIRAATNGAVTADDFEPAMNSEPALPGEVAAGSPSGNATRKTEALPGEVGTGSPSGNAIRKSQALPVGAGSRLQNELIKTHPKLIK